MSSAPPVLHTERLVMRMHTTDDFEDSAAMWGDPVVARFIGGRPFSREEVWSRLLRYVGHWAVLGFGYWCVREAQGGRFVGEVGFADLERTLEPGFDGAPEIGWALASGVHGQGYAREAADAAMAWGDVHFGNVRTVCMIDPTNAPSIRLADKLGYVPYAHTTYKDHATILFERGPR
ncbi:GNAT family N-acetyltransferase [Caulobacter sp. S45]|jgi:RimJ/RimL family protein N-acetyltransferase|uniref:GNAT family N-acetyltransferase n=1 Tax=Caulobacter sp. S45 TaxID=1641861 RepID=UPI00131AAADA|nr:GNAT family N-acetyltransferase [Caulobacter sp. S45]